MAEKDKNDIRKRLEELRKDNNRKNNRQDDGNKSPFSGFLFFIFRSVAIHFYSDIPSGYTNLFSS